jgi:CRP-like cAMP-binding protein
MLVKGEVEVTEKHGKEVVRLGFLAEGAFFGEAPVLGWLGEPGVELRMRTVRAVTDIELIYLSRDDVNTLCEQYAELRARMSRFEKSGRVLTKRALRKIDLSTEEVQEMAAGFKSKLGVSNQVREVFSTRDRPPMRVACWPPLATHLQAQQRSFTTRASIAVTYS